jgi:protein-disulfide isomerase
MTSPRPPFKGHRTAPRGLAGRLRRRLSSPPRRGEPATIVVLFALTASVFAVAPFIGEVPAAPPAQGAAPAFTISTTAGSTYSLGADLGRTPVLVEFMHPDCSHCKNMGPALAAAQVEFGARVRFVSVAIRMGGYAEPTVATVKAFAAAYGHTWTYGIDDGTKARDAYGVAGTPTFVFIGAGGTVELVQPGEMSPDALHGALSSLAGA